MQSFSVTAQAIAAASSEDEGREPRSLEECMKINSDKGKGASELTDDELVMLVREKV